MTILRSGTLLLLALLTLPMMAEEWPIATLPDALVETLGDDIAPDAAVSGDRTLIAWQNANTVYSHTHRVHLRIVSPEGAKPAVPLRVATISPKIASDGSGWLLAYGISGSRFNNSYPYPNVAVRLVTHEGILGDEVVLATSAYPYSSIGSVLWTGDRWAVGFSNGYAGVSFLNSELTEEPVTLTLGPGSAPQLQEIDGRLWAFYTNLAEGAVAEEVFPDGSSGRRHLAAGFNEIQVERTGTETLVALTSPLTQSGKQAVSLASFSPESGFSSSRPLFEGKLFDFYSDAGAFFVVHTCFGCDTVSISRVAADGTLEILTTLAEGGYFRDAVVRRTAEGLVLLVSALAGAEYPQNLGLYSFPVDPFPPAALVWSEARLLSEIATTGNSSPLIVGLGDTGLVFWNQITKSGSMQAWMRQVDRSGAPLAEPVPLPFGYSGSPGFHNPVTAVSEGDRVVLAWSADPDVFAVSISAEGGADAVPVRIGSGYAPSLANRNGVIFIVWQGSDSVVLGTPLASDASPLVPEGFPILRSFTEQQSAPVISAASEGFLVLWVQEGIRSVLISDAGAPQSSSRIASATPFQGLHLATSGDRSLAAWEEAGHSILFTFINDMPSGRFPLGVAGSSPVAILPRGDGSFVFAYTQRSLVFTREITTETFVPQVSAPRLLSRFPLGRNGVALIDGNPVAVWIDGNQVYAGNADATRRRGVSRP